MTAAPEPAEVTAQPSQPKLCAEQTVLESSQSEACQVPAPNAQPSQRSLKPDKVGNSGPAGSARQGTAPQSVTEGVGQASDREVQSGLFLEVFAGTARMSKAFSRVGFQVLAVDSVRPQAVPSLSLDLTLAANQKLILDLIQSRRLAAVHLAPPCGTSSRARAIYAGPQAPQPLRSPLHPDGLPDLPFLQKMRVKAANRLYQFTAQVIRVCHNLGVLWSLENPQSSLFWMTSPIHSLWRELKTSVFFATFDSCVYGGARKKATTFWSNTRVVESLSLRCHAGLGHQHLPWGRQGPGWATTEEAAYPQTLCRHWASLVSEALTKAGRLPGGEQQPGTARYAAAERAALGLFPRATHAPVCVEPFQGHQWIRLECAADRTKFVPGVRLKDTAFPKGSTTIKVSLQDGTWWALVGQPVEPEEFLQRSRGCGHPACSLPPLPPALDKTVSCLSSQRVADIHKTRCQRLKSMCDMARELQPQEDALQSSLQPHLKTILQGKRLHLFSTMLKGIDYPDTGLVQDMLQGFRLTGWLPDTQTRPSKVVPPSLHRDEVWDARLQHNQALWDLCSPSGDADLDQALWEQTLAECEAGWAVLETGHTQAPANCVLGRRFAVRQGGKIRPIDDMSVSLVNCTLGTDEKIVVQPAASTISLAQHIQSRCLSVSRRASQPGAMKGRTFDLKTAFKQLGIHPTDLVFAKVLVWNPRSDRQQSSDLCRSFHQSGHRLHFASHARWFCQSPQHREA